MPIVTPPIYQPSRSFKFSTHQGLKVSVEFDEMVSGFPDTPDRIPMRCADNPLVFSMQTFDESYSPIVAFTADLRFYWDTETSLATFLSVSSHSSRYPHWRIYINIYDAADNLIFQRPMQLSEQDFIEEITDREHVVTLKLYDGLASLKAISFKSNLDQWTNCVTQDKNMTIFDIIGWCVSQAKFSNDKFWVIDNLQYDDPEYDPNFPHIMQMYLNPETFANAEGQTQDCYTVLETILKDNYLELRPTSLGGWLLIRKSDYCRLPAAARIWETEYHGTPPSAVLSMGEISSDNLKFHWIVKDGDVGQVYSRGYSSPVQQYMLQTVTKPIGTVTALANYRNIFTTFPNEFMKEGLHISTAAGVSTYDISCWTFADINTVGTPVTITPVATAYANRFMERDAEGKEVFEMIHFHNVGPGSAMAVARCMVSAKVEMRRNMALKLRWQHTYSPEVTSGIQAMFAIRALTSGGARWVQDDGTLGTAYNSITLVAADVTGKLKGRWALTGSTLEPYYEFDFEVLPLEHDFATFEIYLIGQRADYKLKDFRIESEYYHAGQDDRRIEGQSSVVSRSITSGGSLSETLTQFDSPFYDTAGSIYRSEFGLHQLTSWKWYRYGYTTDDTIKKSFIHQYALGRLVDDRRFFRRVDAMLYGLYVPDEEPEFSSILGFPPERDVANFYRLFLFYDRPSPEDTRYYCLTSFSDYNLKLATANVLMTEVYCTMAGEEVDPDTLTTTESYKILYNGDKTNIDRASMETKDKQLSQGKGWWWLFGPLGWLVWGRKRKIE